MRPHSPNPLPTPSPTVLPATRAPRLARVALTAQPPRGHQGLELHGRGGVGGPRSIARRVPSRHLAEDAREAGAARRGPLIPDGAVDCVRLRDALSGSGGVPWPCMDFGEKDLTLASGPSGSGPGEVPDPSIPGEARHCSPHVTTSSKMALTDRQRLGRSLMGTCRCRGGCARRPGHFGNPQVI